MSVTNPDRVVTKQDLADFYLQIKPYFGPHPCAGFTPVGTIIAVMGNTAPTYYLACEGQTVNIADYQELASYFTTQFDSVDHFGGDGVTTFGIPDLRGEFLRGTGTNSHANQGNGANVGVHQDATEIGQTDYGSNDVTFRSHKTWDSPLYTKQDTTLSGSDALYRAVNPYLKGSYTGAYAYTSRPTNTSVLYCIATKNIIGTGDYTEYSTSEKIVGTWIDGKPIYQKTIYISTSVSGSYTIPISSNIGNVVRADITAKDQNNNVAIIPNGNNNSNYNAQAYVNTSGSIVLTIGSSITYHDLIVTAQYTKTTD